MRTTVNLPDDVLRAARSLADSRGLALGDAIAELVRRGLRPSTEFATRNGFPCFSVPADAEPITLEKTLELEDEW